MQQKQAEAARLLHCVKRRYLFSGGVFVLTMVVWLAIVAIIVVVGTPANGGMPPLLTQALRFAFVPVILAAIAILIVNRRWESQLKSTARRAECRLCPRCLYDLNDTIADEDVRCPECGEVMNLDEVEKRWRAWMG